MTKSEFLSLLSKNLKRFPKAEIDKSIDFYSELIDDKIEDGMGEEEAVKSLGDPAQIARKIIEGSPFSALYTTAKIDERKNVNTTKGASTATIVFLSVTAIIWAPILFALVISLWAVMFALVVSFGAVVIAGLAILFASPFAFIQLGGIAGMIIIGTSLVCIGIGILFFIGVIYLFKGIIYATKYVFRSGKRAFKNGGNR